jgi:hypothetical protein
LKIKYGLIISDSKYVVDSVEKVGFGWEKKVLSVKSDCGNVSSGLQKASRFQMDKRTQ